jgi:hypothetical protein
MLPATVLELMVWPPFQARVCGETPHDMFRLAEEEIARARKRGEIFVVRVFCDFGVEVAFTNSFGFY